MSRRHHLDWHLVGCSSDPVPADESDVRAVASTYRERGQQLRDAHTKLTALSQLSGWKGEAAESFAEKAKERLTDLDKAATRYEDANNALTTFASVVGAERTATKTAVGNASDAQAKINNNSDDPLAGVPEPTPDQQAQAGLEQQRHRDGKTELTAAKSAVTDAAGRLAEAAGKCAQAIRNASEKYKDSWFKDNIVRSAVDAFRVICKVLEVVAIVVAVVGLVAAVFFTAPAWLAGLALGLAVALLASRVLLVYSDTSSATMDDVKKDAIGVALALLGFGAAKHFDKARALVPGTLKNLKAAVPAGAPSGVNPVTRWALRFTTSRNPLARFVGGLAQGRVDRVSARGLEQLTRIENLKATRLQSILALDSEVAKVHAQVRAIQGLRLPGVDIAKEAPKLAEVIRAVNIAKGANIINFSWMVGEDIPARYSDAVPVVKGAARAISDNWRLATAGR